jgi:hypothetical protein
MALPQNTLMYQTKGQKTVRIRRFCIDDETEKAEFEKLATAHANGEITFIGEQSEVYSQKEDKFYLVVRWSESI